MHGIAGSAGPVATPGEAGGAKYGNDFRMNISRGTLRIGFRIQVDRNSPAVGGKLRAGSLRAEGEATAEAGDFCLQA